MNIHAIMHSGQVFRYFETPNGFDIVVGQKFASITINGDEFVIETLDPEFFDYYFDMDTDYESIARSFDGFKSLACVVESGKGIRILRAPFHETVISFIISANNNIKRFTKTLNMLSEKYGDILPNGLYAFPTINQLLCVTVDDYKSLGCGYRSGYLVDAVKMLSTLDVGELATLDTPNLLKQLERIPGVGPKVAGCVALFCGDFHRLDVVPMDTWIKKAFAQIPDIDRDALLNHPYAGVMQQYIFHHVQYLKKEL